MFSERKVQCGLHPLRLLKRLRSSPWPISCSEPRYTNILNGKATVSGWTQDCRFNCGGILQRDYWQTSEFRRRLVAFIFRVRQPKFGLLLPALYRHFQAVINVLAKDNTIAARSCAHLGCQQSNELNPLADLNGLVRFAERRNLVSARVTSHFKRLLRKAVATWRNILIDLIFMHSAVRISEIT